MRYSQKYLEDIEYTLKENDVCGLRNKSILVTGATGLIGSAVIDELIWLNEKADYGIRILAASRSLKAVRDRFAPYSNNGYFQAVRYDALEPFCPEKPVDYIICAASNAHPASIGKEPVETMLANLTGVHNLLEYAAKKGCGRLLYVSSSEVYGRKEDGLLYKEADYGYVDLLNPRSCYPSSKRAAETLCATYKAEYGVDFVIVRPGHVYGPTQTEKDSRASAQFLRAAAEGKDIVMKSPGLQMRSYCHCLDCATAILTVLLKGRTGEAYNISNPDSVVSIRDFAEACAVAAGVFVRYEMPSDIEKANYNMMDNSSLNAKRLMKLGWKGIWDLTAGVAESIVLLNDNIKYSSSRNKVQELK